MADKTGKDAEGVAPPVGDTVGTTGARFRADGGELAIGSNPSNDVVLADPTVSRFHCELRTTPQGVWVVDLDSTNGTSINDIRVKEGLLGHGNVVRMGRPAVASREPRGRAARCELREETKRWRGFSQ